MLPSQPKHYNDFPWYKKLNNLKILNIFICVEATHYLPTCLKKLVIVAFALAQWSQVHWHCVCFFFRRAVPSPSTIIGVSLELRLQNKTSSWQLLQHLRLCGVALCLSYRKSSKHKCVMGRVWHVQILKCANETIPIVLPFAFCLMGYGFFFFVSFFIWQLVQTYF